MKDPSRQIDLVFLQDTDGMALTDQMAMKNSGL